MQEALYGAQSSPTNRLSTLPTELISTIEADLTPGMMSREEALAIREDLMAERSVKRDEEGEVVERDGTLFSGVSGWFMFGVVASNLAWLRQILRCWWCVVLEAD